MRRTGYLLSAAAALALALAPGLAQARAGGSTSQGSRGANTYSAPPATKTAPGTAQPMQRTETPRPAPGVGAPGVGAPAPSRAGSFMSGLAGGLLGAGLAGMLLGHGFGGMAGMLGFLLQIALVGGLIWLVVRLFRGAPRPASAMAGGPAMGGAMARDAMGGQPQGYGGAGGAPSPMRPIDIAASDYQEFERLLIAIQAGWSNRDPNALRGITTPEMFRYFGEQIQESQARGLHNKVTEVRLLSGDLSEAWAEGEREYATVAMKFGLIDATYDAQGRVVEGDPTRPTTATEERTFLRVRGGPWALSAIQQIN